jgi:GT2 family glycosyltransferase
MSIGSVLEKSSYKNFEIIGISNNSTEEATFEEMKYLKNLDNRVSFYEYNVPFNYSDINNHAVTTYAKGEHIIFLNNDIEIISNAWIEEMLMYSQQAQNGAIGAKLYFPNDTVQHAGLVVTPKTIHSVILMYQGLPREDYGYGSRLRCVNNYSAVTAACLMIKHSLFDELNGFDAKSLSIAYNDVDLCLRVQEAGYHNIWTPYCEAYHYESISRGYEVSRESVERREQEKYNLKTKHQEIFTKSDPYYNKNLSRFSVIAELDETVKINYASVEGIAFYEDLILTEKLHEKKHNIITLFSHFDANDEIKEYVIHYIKALSHFTDIIFITTAEKLKGINLEQIKPYCKDIIIKKNIGYDFGAWKSGLDYLDSDLELYEKLILCNDSVYGPFLSLGDICKKMSHYDLWSMTDNHEIEYHLQSYFMAYSSKAFKHEIFTQFWKNIKIYPNKQALIENNEIGFSQQFIDSELSCGVYFSAKDKYFVNVLQYYWKELITEYQFPFIKKEVLITNPLGLDIGQWEDVISSSSNYDITLIHKS